MYHIKTTTEMGRGLYASNPIKRGTVIMRCELLVLSDEDTKSINRTELRYYTFSFTENQDCLVLGDAEIFNHSDDHNVLFKLVPHEDRKVMLFTARRDIQKGEQLFINYQADVQTAKVAEYIANKSLMG